MGLCKPPIEPVVLTDRILRVPVSFQSDSFQQFPSLKICFIVFPIFPHAVCFCISFRIIFFRISLPFFVNCRYSNDISISNSAVLHINLCNTLYNFAIDFLSIFDIIKKYQKIVEKHGQSALLQSFQHATKF